MGNLQKSQKAHGVCRPGRDSAVRGQKDLIGLVRSCCLCALIRGLQNLGASFIKGFNCCGGKLRLRCVDSRFGKPRNFLRGRTGCHFLHRAKSNQKARGAKPHISQLKGKKQQKGRKNQTEGGRNPKQQRRQYEYTRTKSPCAKVHIYLILCVFGESRNRILNA